eukprot:TRINITY_DN111965_c0_g1_i1.p2 TRINITY_DN111965_c0_g1~~TRINITY_DN111965_c0_g1_i1.p2  ORF type:complete len:113 (+),score=52.51 TRINITY_DN111965_c0_g1_i1:106-444(+)
MGKVPPREHDLMIRGGFVYDKEKDKYFMKGEAEWDVQKRIDKGSKQGAVPAKTVEEFVAGEEKMVEALLKKAKEKAASGGSSSSKRKSEEDDGAASKKAKAAEEEEEEEEEE